MRTIRPGVLVEYWTFQDKVVQEGRGFSSIYHAHIEKVIAKLSRKAILTQDTKHHWSSPVCRQSTSTEVPSGWRQ